MTDECACGQPDCSWLAAWDYAEGLLASELREQRGREAFGYQEPVECARVLGEAR